MRNACHVRILKIAIVQRDRNINFLIHTVGSAKKVAPMYIIAYYIYILSFYSAQIEFRRDKHKTHIIIFPLNKK